MSLKTPDGKTLELFALPHRGFEMVGPPLIPLLPLVWKNSRVPEVRFQLVGLEQNSKSAWQFHDWKITVNDSLTAQFPVVTESGSLFFILNESVGIRTIVLEIPSQNLALRFTRDSSWHYLAFWLVHQEGFRATGLPCGKS